MSVKYDLYLLKLRFWTISIIPILSKEGQNNVFCSFLDNIGTMDIVQNFSFNYTSPSFVSYRTYDLYCITSFLLCCKVEVHGFDSR
jgi:hypothetical protein